MLPHYLKALGMEDYEHHVYCFGPDGPIRKRIEDLGVPVHFGKKRDSIKRPLKFALSLSALVLDLLSFIKARRMQIIQAHLGHANQLGVLIGKLSGVPTFLTVHSTMEFLDARSPFDPRKQLIKLVNAFIYRAADRVLAVSEDVKEITCKGIGLDDTRILVVKNGIVLDHNSVNPIEPEELFQVRSESLKLLAVGRLVPLKGFDILIKAVADVVIQGLTNLLVLIIGEGKDRHRLEELITSLNVGKYIKLLGLRNDVMDVMQICDLFVIPSLYEGLSIAMIEAMACGLPIIASDAPGLGSQIKNEKNGLLFPVNDYKALAKQIIRLGSDNDLRAALADGAFQSFETDYDMRRNIRPLTLLFQKFAFETQRFK